MTLQYFVTISQTPRLNNVIVCNWYRYITDLTLLLQHYILAERNHRLPSPWDSNLHLTNGQTILFNKKITEFGANFDTEGAFVCQTPGLYAFTFYALSETGKELWLEMMKNGQLIASSEL